MSVPGPPSTRSTAVAGMENVVAAPAEQDIPAGAAGDRVTSAESADDVGLRRPHELIGLDRAADRARILGAANRLPIGRHLLLGLDATDQPGLVSAVAAITNSRRVSRPDRSLENTIEAPFGE